MQQGKTEETALGYLPSGISTAVKKSMALYKGSVSEIRLRCGRPVFITCNNKNISCGIVASKSDIDTTVRTLCGNSLYSHSESIKDGYICTNLGIRAGICGRAVTEGGSIIGITDISSVCIRIPHRAFGIADPIVKRLIELDGGILIYSKPGVGKTTMLREITARLSSPPFCLRTAVVDTRFEICGALEGSYSIDALSGYPRDKGMETALRTLSPQYIICDEIASEADAAAVKSCAGAGVSVIASAHAGSIEELWENERIAALITKSIFKTVVKLERHSERVSVTITDPKGMALPC